MKKIALLLIVSLFLVSFVVAVEPAFVVKQNTNYDLKVSCENQGNFCSGGANCNLTVNHFNSTTIVDNQNMTNLGNGYFSYPLTSSNTAEGGTYTARAWCGDGAHTATTTFTYEVTPTGVMGTLGFYIILLILSLVIVVIGYSVEDAWVVILGSFGFILLGLFILLYGVVGLKDTVYTYSFGIITIMLGSYFGIRGALEKIDF